MASGEIVLRPATVRKEKKEGRKKPWETAFFGLFGAVAEMAAAASQSVRAAAAPLVGPLWGLVPGGVREAVSPKKTGKKREEEKEKKRKARLQAGAPSGGGGRLVPRGGVGDRGVVKGQILSKGVSVEPRAPSAIRAFPPGASGGRAKAAAKPRPPSAAEPSRRTGEGSAGLMPTETGGQRGQRGSTAEFTAAMKAVEAGTRDGQGGGGAEPNLAGDTVAARLGATQGVPVAEPRGRRFSLKDLFRREDRDVLLELRDAVRRGESSERVLDRIEQMLDERESVFLGKTLVALERGTGIRREAVHSIVESVAWGWVQSRVRGALVEGLGEVIGSSAAPVVGGAFAVGKLAEAYKRGGAARVYERYAFHPEEWLRSKIQDKDTRDWIKESKIKRGGLWLFRTIGRTWNLWENAAVQVVYGLDRKRSFVTRAMEKLGALNMSDEDLKDEGKWQEFFAGKLASLKPGVQKRLVKTLVALEEFGYGASVYGELGSDVHRVNQRLAGKEVFTALHQGLRGAMPDGLRQYDRAEGTLRKETALVGAVHFSMGVAKVVGVGALVNRLFGKPARPGEASEQYQPREVGQPGELPGANDGPRLVPGVEAQTPQVEAGASTPAEMPGHGVVHGLEPGAGAQAGAVGVPQVSPGSIRQPIVPLTSGAARDIGSSWDYAQTVGTAEGLGNNVPVLNASMHVIEALKQQGMVPSQEAVAKLERATAEAIRQVEVEGVRVESLEPAQRQLYELGRVGWIRESLASGGTGLREIAPDEARSLVETVVRGE